MDFDWVEERIEIMIENSIKERKFKCKLANNNKIEGESNHGRFNKQNNKLTK